MNAIQFTRQKLDCSQREFADCLLIPSNSLAQVEIDRRYFSQEVMDQFVVIHKGLLRIAKERIITPEAQEIIEAERTASLVEMKALQQDLELQVFRQRKKLKEMIDSYERNCEALNNACWFVRHHKDASPKIKDWMKWKADVATTNIKKFGLMQQWILQNKISSLENELRSLDSILSE